MIDMRFTSRESFEEHFSKFSGHLDNITPILQAFADRSGLILLRDVAHHPSRVLHREGNPNWWMFVSLSEDWRNIKVSNGLMYEFEVQSYYQPSTGTRLEKKRLLATATLTQLKEELESLLVQGVTLLTEWRSPEEPIDDRKTAEDGWF